MDVLEAMRKRRRHRYFAPAQLDEEALRILAWAATRAPSGGNQPSRSVVVNDRRLVRAVVEVTPSYIGTVPAAIIVVCTDVESAEQNMGMQAPLADRCRRGDRAHRARRRRARDRLLPLQGLERVGAARSARSAADRPGRPTRRLIPDVFDDAFLRSIQPELEREKQKVMSDRDSYVAWADDLAGYFAAEAKRRNLAEAR